jgi:hypothetical protein
MPPTIQLLAGLDTQFRADIVPNALDPRLCLMAGPSVAIICPADGEGMTSMTGNVTRTGAPDR